MWHNSQSTEQPQLIDTTSSNFVVYLRKDITTEEINNTIYYNYKEYILSKSDWEAINSCLDTYPQIEKNTANIDYIAIMSDIDLED